jgi:hypothetical protein
MNVAHIKQTRTYTTHTQNTHTHKTHTHTHKTHTQNTQNTHTYTHTKTHTHIYTHTQTRMANNGPYHQTMVDEKKVWEGYDNLWVVLDFERQKKIEFGSSLAFREGLCAFLIPFTWVCLPCCITSLLLIGPNTRGEVMAEHAALTQDGIIYKIDRHKTGLRLDCQDVGAVTKTVPYDRIQDVQVMEPAGSSGPCCCMVPNVLSTVNIQTAAQGGPAPELSLTGVKDPHELRKMLQVLKRGESLTLTDGRTVHMNSAGSSSDGLGGKSGLELRPKANSASDEETKELLREQVSLLRSIDASLKARA